MADFTIKQADTQPVLSDTLTYSDGTAVNLTGATVKMVWRALTANATSVNAAATIVTAAAGTVSYTPTSADTAVAGQYLANWIVTFSGGAVMTFPTVGYIDITVEENLTTAGGATIVALGEVKDHLNFTSTDRGHDAELLRLINGITPIVENLAGTVLATTVEEWHSGGQPFIMLRKRPVITLIAVSEYRGPTEYTLAIVTDPAHSSTYTVQLVSPERGRVVRRTAGGGITPFPAQLDSVHVVYQAGRVTVPDNVRYGSLELVRVNYQQTQQGGRPQYGTGSGQGDDYTGQMMMGFFVPNRVREILAPSARFPSLA